MREETNSCQKARGVWRLERKKKIEETYHSFSCDRECRLNSAGRIQICIKTSLLFKWNHACKFKTAHKYPGWTEISHKCHCWKLRLCAWSAEHRRICWHQAFFAIDSRLQKVRSQESDSRQNFHSPTCHLRCCWRHWWPCWINELYYFSSGA